MSPTAPPESLHPPAIAGASSTEAIAFRSLGAEIHALFVHAPGDGKRPVLVVAHGAGEFKENYLEMASSMARRGISSLLLDMHGHGASGGAAYHVSMKEWTADLVAALDFLCHRDDVDPKQIGALGLSSGGTAILETALVDPRLRALVALDATVMNTLPLSITLTMGSLTAIGCLKRWLTGQDLRISIVKLLEEVSLASDPAVNAKLRVDPGKVRAFKNFPLPGASQAFFVNTIRRVPKITAPTLVIWGEEDNLDPVSTAQAIHDALTCEKRLEIVPGNGHVGHLDRNRQQVFDLTAEWILNHLARTTTNGSHVPHSSGMTRPILGQEARDIDPQTKWAMLSPFIRRHGREALSYATLQQGMEYFVHDDFGYIAFTTATHPVFARKPKRIVLADPVCDREHLRPLIAAFLKEHPAAVFGVVSGHCAGVLRQMGFKANCVGYEPELPVQTYNTLGNWKELDLIKRARNEAKREGITIREVDIATVPVEQLQALSAKWILGKKVNDREIWVYARRPVYQSEPDVRKFVAFNREGTAVGYAFYDPMYRDGRVYGYAANTVRCDEARYGRLATAIHMTAVEIFRPEGAEVLNLCLCPFTKLDAGMYSDDPATRWFFKLSERYGGELYNFKGLSFHKSKYRGAEKPLYYASNSALPSNDIYLAFLTSDIARSYFGTMGLLLRGVVKETFGKRD